MAPTRRPRPFSPTAGLSRRAVSLDLVKTPTTSLWRRPQGSNNFDNCHRVDRFRGNGPATMAGFVRPIFDKDYSRAPTPPRHRRCPLRRHRRRLRSGSRRARHARASHAVIGSIAINEVESNGDPDGDWVELTNNADFKVDISEWQLRDNDDTHSAVTIPQGTTIAAGGFFMVYIDRPVSRWVKTHGHAVSEYRHTCRQLHVDQPRHHQLRPVPRHPRGS